MARLLHVACKRAAYQRLFFKISSPWWINKVRLVGREDYFILSARENPLSFLKNASANRNKMTPFYPKKDDGLPGPIDIDVLLRHVYETLQFTPIAKPPCECADCINGFYTVKAQSTFGLVYRYRLSDEDAERRVLLAVKKMGDLQRALTERLDVFPDILMSRWIKQSQAKREALLKEAAPDLEDKQWLLPRYSLLRPQCYLLGSSQKGRRGLLLPWLNVEVLTTNPAVLFALLHYRTAYSPQHWAAFDSQQLALSWAVGLLEVDFSPKCVVMYGQKYGSLVD